MNGDHQMKRLKTLATAAAAAAWLAACAQPPAAPPRTVVLVHGAWMGAWSWDRVAAELRERRLDVKVVELPGHGDDPTPPERLSLEAYVKAVTDALPAQGRATVVGHSMAGMVISQAAERVPERVGRLVYVAAYLPRDGQSLYQISQTDADSRVPRFWQQAHPQAYSPATIRAEGLAEVFCADCAPADLALLAARHRAEAVPPLATPVKLSAERWGAVPKLYVHTLRDGAVSYALQRTMVANAGPGVATATLDSAHAPMLTQPKALAELIAKAVP